MAIKFNAYGHEYQGTIEKDMSHISEGKLLVKRVLTSGGYDYIPINKNQIIQEETCKEFITSAGQIIGFIPESNQFYYIDEKEDITESFDNKKDLKIYIHLNHSLTKEIVAFTNQI